MIISQGNTVFVDAEFVMVFIIAALIVGAFIGYRTGREDLREEQATPRVATGKIKNVNDYLALNRNTMVDVEGVTYVRIDPKWWQSLTDGQLVTSTTLSLKAPGKVLEL